MSIIRCPFCEFDRSQRRGEEWSAVRAERELAVHLVFKHPQEWRELVETAGTEPAEGSAPDGG